MCGICGIVGNSASEEIRLMNSKLIHRGPDGEGYHESENIRLGHRRLKVIDLSELASQPMSNEDGTIWMTFNGEIYNFQDLRTELIQKGHKFVSKTDSEVIIHGYEEWGELVVNKLLGMFAFGIWNSKDRSLFLARDRLGVKPLYYFFDDSRFAFASQISALLQIHHNREIDFTSFACYMVMGYAPHPSSMVKGISKLPGGWHATFKGGKLIFHQYWKLQINSSKNDSIKEVEAYEHIQYLIDNAVKRRLVSDVPLGIFLSGGVDSSVILAEASRISSNPVKAFSIGYEEDSFNETPYSEQIAKHFKADYYPFILKQQMFSNMVNEIIRFLDEPIADVSLLPTYSLSKMTRQHVTVALGGDGCDETFSGYITHQNWQIIHLFSKMPVSFFSKALKSILDVFPSNFNYLSWDYKLRGFLAGLEYPSKIRNFIWLGAFTPEEAENILSEDVKESLPKSGITGLLEKLHSGNGNALDQLLFQDVNYFLQDYLLVKVDLMSMANSLEVRGPFLDTEIIDFVSKLPVKFKVQNRNPKQAVKNIYRPVMPPNFFDRKKQGFSVPLGHWLHKKDVKDFFIDTLSEYNIHKTNLFNYKTINALLNEHIKGVKNNWKQLWAVLIIQLWYNTHIKK